MLQSGIAMARRGRSSGTDYSQNFESDRELLGLSDAESGFVDLPLHYAPHAKSSCLTPVARLVPDRMLLFLMVSSLAWCWVSSWLLMTIGNGTKLSWNVSTCQLLPLTVVSFLAGLKIYLLKPLEDELSHFKAENGKFKDSIGQLQVVAGSLKTEKDQYKTANEQLQLSIGELENVRGVIETYAAKNHGDISAIAEEVKRSVYEQMHIQQKTKRIQQRIRGLISVLLNTTLMSNTRQSPGGGGLAQEDLKGVMAALSGAGDLDGQDLATALASPSPRQGLDDDDNHALSDMLRSNLSKLAQLDKEDEEDADDQCAYKGVSFSETQRLSQPGSPQQPPHSPGSPASVGSTSQPRGFNWQFASRPATPSSRGPTSPAPATLGPSSPLLSGNLGRCGDPLLRSAPSRTASQRGGDPLLRSAPAGHHPTFDFPRTPQPQRATSFDRVSVSSDRSTGRTPRIAFCKDEVGTYFGDGDGHPAALPRLPEEREQADAGVEQTAARSGAAGGKAAVALRGGARESASGGDYSGFRVGPRSRSRDPVAQQASGASWSSPTEENVGGLSFASTTARTQLTSASSFSTGASSGRRGSDPAPSSAGTAADGGSGSGGGPSISPMSSTAELADEADEVDEEPSRSASRD